MWNNVSVKFLFRTPSAYLRKLLQSRLITTLRDVSEDLIEKPSSNQSDGIIGGDVAEFSPINNVADDELLVPGGRAALEDFAPYFMPTFNFAAYINKSPTLQELVKLGVNLHMWEKRKGIPNFVLRLDFERDMKHMIRFLHDNGVPADNLGYFITKNPLIFKESIENLQIRINYLEAKQFTREMIGRVVSHNPYWLMFSTTRIDRRLGHFQRTFELTGSDVRELSTKRPRLITYNMDNIKEITFVVKELIGYQPDEMKVLLLKIPKLWMMNKQILLNRFNYVHSDMGISHAIILEMPGILRSRLFRVKQRHLFLQKCCPKPPDGRSRYDPESIGYVSLNALISGNDAEFCNNVAKTSIETFNSFLKSL